MANCKCYAVFALALLVLFLSGPSLAQTTCTKSFTVNNSNKLFSSCRTLRQLGANFAWTYDPVKRAISMAFTATPGTSGGWVSWGINPLAPAMAGTQSLIAFKHSNGSILVNTYNVTGANKMASVPLNPSAIDYKVEDMMAEFKRNQITIFAKWILKNNKTTVNHVWQTGSQVKGLVPKSHEFNLANLQSLGSIDLKTGVASVSPGIPHLVLKNTHGVLNVVGWSIILPIGVMFARYMRRYVKSPDSVWFYFHVFCQIMGFMLGVAGWATGLKLGSYSKGIVYSQHRNLGIAIFSICTVQMTALLVRPKKEHKIRFFWNIYHHSMGYSIIVLSIVNIFKGFDILQPEDKWKRVYIAVIGALGGVAIIFEMIYWISVLRQKSSTSSKQTNDV